MDLTKSLFQFCFSFTMKQKLAPLWNKAGEFLVQGIVNVHLKIGVMRETRPLFIMRHLYKKNYKVCVERFAGICARRLA